MLDRAAIFRAIAQRIGTDLGITVALPRSGFAPPPNPVEQTSAVLLPYEEQPDQRVGLPPVHHVFAELRFYLRTDDVADDATADVNALIGAVDSALVATDAERAADGGLDLYATTLGGLVLFCWREHTVVEPGQMGRQAIVAMVLHVAAPEP